MSGNNLANGVDQQRAVFWCLQNLLNGPTHVCSYEDASFSFSDKWLLKSDNPGRMLFTSVRMQERCAVERVFQCSMNRTAAFVAEYDKEGV